MNWQRTDKHLGAFHCLTVVIGAAQCPGLIGVKVCVSSDASPREIRVG